MALIKISAKYSNYVDVFSFDLAIELPKITDMNKHAIKLIDGKQPSYRPIYILNPMELETLKTYIETHLKTVFIQLSKFLTNTLIFFNKKLDDSFCLCINYRGLNNLTIKN